MLENIGLQVERAAKARYGNATGTGSLGAGGMRNARGEWFENILGIIFWNVAIKVSSGRTAVVNLPNSNQMRFHHLFEQRSRTYLEELHDSLEDEGISITMSNPDFICITDLDDETADYFKHTLQVSLDALDKMSEAYQRIKGKCRADAMPFAMTVKTSIRPDRRYQIVHEANVVKSLVAHLAGRFWNRNLYTAFCAIVLDGVSSSDRQALQNPATHSLVQVSWKPVVLVDDVFSVDEVSDVEDIIRQLLTQSPNDIIT